jgi:hypothetical protein
MNALRYTCVFAAIYLLCGCALGQQSAPPASLSSDMNSIDAQDQDQSLGDLARKVQKDHTTEVQMSADDAKKLFDSVDTIVAFAAEDTGFAKHSSVERRLVGREEVEKFTRAQLAKQENSFMRSEMTMKKFGFLPRDFDLKEFMIHANGTQVAGYYDESTKSIQLLNWIPFENQAPILAHELTHALQDQNFNLKTWQKADQPDADDDDVAARHAVVEGQAMVVMLDYMLAPLGRTVQNTPGLIYQMEDPAVKATFDSPLLHSAPMILREAGAFPYQSGLVFEGELLQKGGQQMAFAGVFARPPQNTHEILDPGAYINNEKLPAVNIPDLRPLLDGAYQVYDSGSIGELDVRGLLKQYGDRIIADELASSWRGGSYVTFRKAIQGVSATGTPATTDLALLYVSHWQSAQAADRFAHLYAAAVGQRYAKAETQPAKSCSHAPCPVSSVEVDTEEGPVIVERWANNRVVISESFDLTTAAKLRNAVLDNTDAQANYLQNDELSLRLEALPGFAAFQEVVGQNILEEVQSQLNH